MFGSSLFPRMSIFEDEDRKMLRQGRTGKKEGGTDGGREIRGEMDGGCREKNRL